MTCTLPSTKAVVLMHKCIRGSKNAPKTCYSILSHRHTRLSKRFTFRSISTSIKASGTENPTGYCREIVRKHDYEGFLNHFAYPAHLRDGYFALKAFNVRSLQIHGFHLGFIFVLRCLLQVELVTIPESTSQSMIAQMRLQFWKDAVKLTYEVRRILMH